MWKIIRQASAPLGSGASLFAASVNMGCCAPAIVWSITASLSSVGLGFLVDAGVTGAFFYGSLGLSGLGLTMTAIRSRSVVPMASGAVGIGAILFAFSRGMDVWVFQTLVYGGLGLLILGSGWPLLRAAARKISHLSRIPAQWECGSNNRRRRPPVAKDVIIYTQPGWSGCSAEKEFLSQKGVEFVAKDIREDPEALAELQRLGYRATPVTVIDGEVVVGFDRGKLQRLLGIS